MAFLEGDIITADLLNSTNGEVIEYASGHLDSNGKKPYSFFFYLNRPAGDEFGEGECGCGYFSGSWITPKERFMKWIESHCGKWCIYVIHDIYIKLRKLRN